MWKRRRIWRKRPVPTEDEEDRALERWRLEVAARAEEEKVVIPVCPRPTVSPTPVPVPLPRLRFEDAIPMPAVQPPVVNSEAAPDGTFAYYTDVWVEAQGSETLMWCLTH